MIRIFLMLALGLTLLLWAGITFVNNRITSLQTATLDNILHEAQELSADVSRGEYVAYMGGCIACHSHYTAGGKTLAGGVPINTQFGTFYSPNITGDEAAGIGAWSTADFIQAMVVGVSPDSQHYYPSFPYTSYTVMSAQDLVDLKAWLDTVEPVAIKAPTHTIAWPFSIRGNLIFWKALFFDYSRTDTISPRGRYLVEGPGHCAECHSPRNLLGGYATRSLIGNQNGPDGQSVPDITATALSDWTVEDLELFLEVGILVNGDFTGGHMADVIEYSTGLLTASDRREMAQFLLSGENGL